MASYCFYLKGDEAKKPVKLGDIDAEAAGLLGEKPDPSFMQYENTLSEVGFALLMKNGGMEINNWKPGDANFILKKECPDDLRKKINTICDGIFGKYVFMAWR